MPGCVVGAVALFPLLRPPQASVAPRPMMPRCSSLPAPAEGGDTRPPFLQQPTSIRSNPGLSNNDRSRPRSAAVAPSHGGSSSAYTGFIQPRSLSVPSINTPGSCSVDYTAVSADNAWLDLQREMGSLKADNRMFLRGSRGISAHALRTSESAVSVLTKSLAENSTVCAEATTDLLAKTLSVGLDGPAPVWKGDRPGKRLPESVCLSKAPWQDTNNLTAKSSNTLQARMGCMCSRLVRLFSMLVGCKGLHTVCSVTN